MRLAGLVIVAAFAADLDRVPVDLTLPLKPCMESSIFGERPCFACDILDCSSQIPRSVPRPCLLRCSVFVSNSQIDASEAVSVQASTTPLSMFCSIEIVHGLYYRSTLGCDSPAAAVTSSAGTTRSYTVWLCRRTDVLTLSSSSA